LAQVAPVAASPGPTPARAASTPAPAGDAGTPTSPTPSPAPPAAPTPVPVIVDKEGFHPSTLRVYSGQVVSWTNNEAKTSHTATAADGSWDTGPIEPGRSQLHQFFEAGKWEYVDGFNPALRGVLIVATPSSAPRAAPSPASSPAPSAAPSQAPSARSPAPNATEPGAEPTP
jgi:plastocyanin